jgi:EAL domain-containing protein (putative c-di-GMP-specific phosphodiesterase class I)
VPLAEHTGLIEPLTQYVLEHALSQCRQWIDADLDLSVAVNLSVRNLLDPHLPDKVSDMLKKWGVPPSRLKLEITESIIMADPKRATATLDKLSQMGVELSIDDFGTGYSSLSHLKRLPVDEIKIDKSFVMNMVADENDSVIVRSTIDLGRNLGLKVVAEGVETEAVWAALGQMGCDQAQGFLRSRPLPAAELTRWLEDLRAPWPASWGKPA